MFPGLGGQGVAGPMKVVAGPIETIVSVAKVKVSMPGWPGCCWTYESGCDQMETIVSVAKV